MKKYIGVEGALALCGIAVLLVAVVLATGRGSFAEKTDFSCVYTGARIVYQGDGPKLYSPEEQGRLRISLFDHPNPHICEHTAYEAVLLTPLAALSYRSAYIAWGLLNVCVWLLLPCLLRPYAAYPKNTVGYFATWILFAPLGVALFQGQVSIVLLLVFTMVFINLQRGNEVQAGLCLALGLLKFQMILPFAFIFLLRRRWKFLSGFLFTGALLGLVSLITIGWQGVLSYVHLLFAIAHNPGSAAYGAAADMPTIRGFVYGLFRDRISLHVLGGVVAALSLTMLVFTAWRWHKEDLKGPKGSQDVMFAGALAVSLLAGFHVLSHDLSPLMLSLLLVAKHYPDRSSSILRWTLAATLGFFWFPPLYFGLLVTHHLYLICPVLMIFALLAFRLAGNSGGSIVMEEVMPPTRVQVVNA
jgi:hypothetical protein